MKKTISIVFIAIAMTLLATSVFAGATGFYKTYPIVGIEVNGNSIAAADVPAFIIDNRTVVPLRLIGEALGAEIDWDQSNNVVRITTTTTIEKAAKPDKSLITAKITGVQSDFDAWSKVSGTISNDNDKSVNAFITFHFLNPLNEEINHVHLNGINLLPGKSEEFTIDFKGSLAGYSKVDTIVEWIEWNE